MELNEYQKQAMETCMESCGNFSYMMLNLVGEVGEFAGKVAKGIRKRKMHIGRNGYRSGENLLFVGGDKEYCLEALGEMRKEAGDILWQLAGLCDAMGWTLEDVAEENLRKLASRKERGVIDGNGDNR